jgi:hypothetical protein
MCSYVSDSRFETPDQTLDVIPYELLRFEISGEFSSKTSCVICRQKLVSNWPAPRYEFEPRQKARSTL